jgi:hypothetical protein
MRNKMKIAIVGITALLAIAIHAQVSPQPPVQPGQPAAEILTVTDVEKYKLQSDTKDLIILQLQYQQAQSAMKTLQDQFNASKAKVDEDEKSTKLAHKWGDDVTLNPQTQNYERHVKPLSPAKSQMQGPGPQGNGVEVHNTKSGTQVSTTPNGVNVHTSKDGKVTQVTTGPNSANVSDVKGDLNIKNGEVQPPEDKK